VRLWRRHPLLGVGPDNFRRLYPEVIAPARPGRHFKDDRMHANSLYLETLADLGLAGLAALVLLMVAVARQALAHALAGRLLPLAAAVAVASFFVHGVLDYFLEFTPSYGLYWLLLALAAAGWRPRAASSPGSRGSEPPR
jgi:O-antigen ligase